MDTLIESIRAAIADDASDDARTAGAVACRAILAALEAQSGQPLAQPAGPSTIAATVSALRSAPPDQLLDLVIARLRSKLPADAATTPARSVAFQLVALPPHLRGR